MKIKLWLFNWLFADVVDDLLEPSRSTNGYQECQIEELEDKLEKLDDRIETLDNEQGGQIVVLQDDMSSLQEEFKDLISNEDLLKAHEQEMLILRHWTIKLIAKTVESMCLDANIDIAVLASTLKETTRS